MTQRCWSASRLFAPLKIRFGLLLKYLAWKGRFPRGRGEVPDNAVDHVARQVGIPPEELGLYDWAGRQSKRHRVEVRQHLGFRECSVADADKLTAWLAEHVAQAERRPERVREELLAHCRVERIEPPTVGRIDRMVASALHQAEEALSVRIAARLSTVATVRLQKLVAAAADDAGPEEEQEAEGPAPLALIKSDPGNVSLETMLAEIGKLEAVRAVGLPPGLFADVAPKVVAAWRARATVEAPSHLRTHPEPLRLTLLAALLHTRERELTDTLVDLLPHQRAGREEDHRGADPRVQAGHRQGDHPVPDRGGRRRASRRYGARRAVPGGARR